MKRSPKGKHISATASTRLNLDVDSFAGFSEQPLYEEELQSQDHSAGSAGEDIDQIENIFNFSTQQFKILYFVLTYICWRSSRRWQLKSNWHIRGQRHKKYISVYRHQRDYQTIKCWKIQPWLILEILWRKLLNFLVKI